MLLPDGSVVFVHTLATGRLLTKLASIIPVPLLVILAPEPTIIEALVLVPLVMALNELEPPPPPQVPHVLGDAPPPPEMRHWPVVPAVVGILKLYVPAAACGNIEIVPDVVPLRRIVPALNVPVLPLPIAIVLTSGCVMIELPIALMPVKTGIVPVVPVPVIVPFTCKVVPDIVRPEPKRIWV